jgi:hypothetical protein
MDEKHTPGPWSVTTKLSGSENHRGFKIVSSEIKGWSLAEVIPIDQDGIEGGANARLMAAAPRMLKALQALISADEEQGLDDTLFDDARAAVAQAVGAA